MSLRDRFFGGQEEEEEIDLLAKVRGWDGMPVIRWSWSDVAATYGLAPHWQVKMRGPMIPWVGTLAAIDVLYLVVATREEAIAAAYDRAHEACAGSRMPWDPEEWTVTQLLPKNCN